MEDNTLPFQIGDVVGVYMDEHTTPPQPPKLYRLAVVHEILRKNIVKADGYYYHFKNGEYYGLAEEGYNFTLIRPLNSDQLREAEEEIAARKQRFEDERLVMSLVRQHSRADLKRFLAYLKLYDAR